MLLYTLTTEQNHREVLVLVLQSSEIVLWWYSGCTVDSAVYTTLLKASSSHLFATVLRLYLLHP